MWLLLRWSRGFRRVEYGRSKVSTPYNFLIVLICDT